MDTIFTGEAGGATYLLMVLLISLAIAYRSAGRSGDPRRNGFKLTVAGLVFLFLFRVSYILEGSARHSWFSLVSFGFGGAGLYLLLTPMMVGSDGSAGTRVNNRVLTIGGLVGAFLGLILFLSVSGRLTEAAAAPILYSFITFVPLGILLGSLWEGKGYGPGRLIIPALSGGFFVGATLIAGLSYLGLLGADPFWIQFFTLTDLAGFFFLFFAAAAAPLDFVGRSSREPGRSFLTRGIGRDGDTRCIEAAERIYMIGNRSVHKGKAQETYNVIVKAVAEELCTPVVILRVVEAHDDLYEVKVHTGLEGEQASLASTLSVTEEMFLRRCGQDRFSEIGFVLDWDSAGSDRDSFIPRGIEWQGKKILVIPISEDGLLKGFFTCGFFEDVPSSDSSIFLDIYANQVIQIVQHERQREQLLEKERMLSICKEELSSVNQLKANFLSIVSHELRTPLTSVKAYTETLLDNIETMQRNTIHDFLNVMDEENDRLIKLIDNVLNYSCMETGHLKVEKTSCNLNEMVSEAQRGLNKEFLDGGVNCDLRLPRTSVVIEADRELISQLLQNLMSNAVKFTPKGGTVTVALEEEAAAVRIVVQDTGKGIPEGQLEKIFERFHQVDASNTREHGGSGLGLAICKNIVDWHDGKIWVENVKEAGAKFIVLLPMKDIVVRQSASVGFFGSRRFERERYMTLLVEMLSEFLQARKASIMLLDPEQQILRIVAAKGLESEFVQNTRLDVGDRIAGWVAQTGEPLHVFDIEKDIVFGRANNSSFYGTHSFISVPLIDDNEIIGVLNVSDHVEGIEFTEADRELLESLSGIIAGMLKKLDAFEKVTMNFERLKKAMRSILDIRELWGSKTLSNLTLIALATGRRLNLDERSLTALRLGMNLYDLGMMEVPRNIRAKKEELTDEEWGKLRNHPNFGYTLASPMGLEERIMKMVLAHHENYDGSGYPNELSGEEILIEARIVNVVDAFRALITQGPYRRCFTIDEARNEIIKGAGKKFDPKVVGAFVKVLSDLGAREGKCELVLDAVEEELEAERKKRKQIWDEHQQETVKEGVP